jgi:hypothetical protein
MVKRSVDMCLTEWKGNRYKLVAKPLSSMKGFWTFIVKQSSLGKKGTPEAKVSISPACDQLMSFGKSFWESQNDAYWGGCGGMCLLSQLPTTLEVEADHFFPTPPCCTGDWTQGLYMLGKCCVTWAMPQPIWFWDRVLLTLSCDCPVILPPLPE